MRKILIVQRKLMHYRRLLLQYLMEQGDYEIEILQIGEKTEHSDNLYTFPAKELIKYKNYSLQRSDGMISFVKENYQSYDYIILEGATNLINNIPICTFLIKNKKTYVVWDAGRRKNSKMSLPRKLVQKKLEFVWKNAAAIIAYSSLAKQYFESVGVESKKIFVCQNTLYVEEFDRQIAQQSLKELAEIRDKYAAENKKIILYVGAVEPRKRIKDLVDAFILLSEKRKDLSLVIIGSGNQLEELKDYTSEKEEVYLLGSIIDGVIKYFMAADLFALPSEGGLSINQAMICGKPIVASSADGTELDLIEEGKNGYLFSEGNVQEMAEVMNRILIDDTKRKVMGNYSRTIIETRVNEKQFYENFKKCLNSVD